MTQSPAADLAVRADVRIREVDAAHGARRVLSLLDAARGGRDVPLVDEAEEARLRALADTGRRPPDWWPLTAVVGEQAVGYAGLLAGPRGDPAVADLAVERRGRDVGGTLEALLAGVERLAWARGSARLQAWLRDAAGDDAGWAVRAGYLLERRLAVLGRSLRDPVAGGEVDGDGVRIRGHVPGRDDDRVVEVLAAAYEGTPEAGWDAARLAARRELDWFRAEDLLLALDEDGRPLGLHWTKRRSPTSGEVYNLAVHPRARGRGLGGRLLAAGLAHLREVGCEQVLLWVDLANERAVRLYRSHGFTTRWEDHAIGRELCGPLA